MPARTRAFSSGAAPSRSKRHVVVHSSRLDEITYIHLGNVMDTDISGCKPLCSVLQQRGVPPRLLNTSNTGTSDTGGQEALTVNLVRSPGGSKEERGPSPGPAPSPDPTGGQGTGVAQSGSGKADQALQAEGASVERNSKANLSFERSQDATISVKDGSEGNRGINVSKPGVQTDIRKIGGEGESPASSAPLGADGGQSVAEQDDSDTFLEGVSDRFQDLMEDASDAFLGASDRMEDFLDVVRGQDLDVDGGLENMLAQQGSDMSSAGHPLSEKAVAAAQTFSSLKEAFEVAPQFYTAAVALTASAVAYTYFSFEYGGFKGVLDPLQLLAALNKDGNYMIIDVRPQSELEQNGVLDLKRRARRKATSLPLQEVPEFANEEAEISDEADLKLQMNAALICNLEGVNAFTNVVIMDIDGSTSKKMARAVTRLGRRGYMLRGGFNNWRDSGLAVKMGDYSVLRDAESASESEDWW